MTDSVQKVNQGPTRLTEMELTEKVHKALDVDFIESFSERINKQLDSTKKGFFAYLTSFWRKR